VTSVTVKSLENLQQVVVTPEHEFTADEPRDEGGDGLGPSPYELLLAALGTCTAMTILLYVRRERLASQDGGSRRLSQTHYR